MLQYTVLLTCLAATCGEQWTYIVNKDEGIDQSLLNDDYSTLETLPLLDESVDSVSLPFSFYFFGKSYSHAYVSSNGFLSFSNSHSEASARALHSSHDMTDIDMNTGVIGDNTFIAILHRKCEASHLMNFVSHIQDFRSNQRHPLFQTRIRSVHEHLRMVCIEAPSPEAIKYLTKHEHVISVSRNHEVHVALSPASLDDTYTPPVYAWGLDRIDQANLPLNKAAYSPAVETKSGQGVDVYVLDTGLDVLHEEFASVRDTSGDVREVGIARNVSNVFNYYGKLSDNTDNNGHGTHCAGTIGGSLVGVAPAANLFGVKVLDGQGKGSVLSILAGLDFIGSRQALDPTRPMVVSMSLGGFCGTECQESPLNVAVNTLSELGVVVVVAAGNTDSDACQYAPASASSAITVGAVTSNDTMATFSCTGACVDLLAPGQSVLSACSSAVQDMKCAGSPYQVLSGTSMAAPHVSGVAALWIAQTKNHSSQTANATFPALIKRVIQCGALEGAIGDIAGGTVNLLLQVPTPNVTSLEQGECDAAATCDRPDDISEMCSGHGQCFFGSCKCDLDWTGEFCTSYLPELLSDPLCCDGGDLADFSKGPFATIAMLWTDLNPESPLSGPVLYGPVADDAFAVVFSQVAAYGIEGCVGTVEVVMHKSGTFEMALLSNAVGYSCGARSVTMGIRGPLSRTRVEFEQIYGPASRGLPPNARLSFTPRSANSSILDPANLTGPLSAIATPGREQPDVRTLPVGCKPMVVTMHDSQGDGWNGNYLHFSHDINVTLANGWEGSATVCLPPGAYTPHACGGSGADEVTWILEGLRLRGSASGELSCSSADYSLVLVVGNEGEESPPPLRPSAELHTELTSSSASAPTSYNTENVILMNAAAPDTNTSCGGSNATLEVLLRQDRILSLISLLLDEKKPQSSTGSFGGRQGATESTDSSRDGTIARGSREIFVTAVWIVASAIIAMVFLKIVYVSLSTSGVEGGVIHSGDAMPH